MCELQVYMARGEERELLAEGVIRLYASSGKVTMENIFGEVKEIAGRILDVNILSQEALLVSL